MATSRPLKIPESVLVVVHSRDLQVLLLERADQPGCWQSVTGAKDSVDEPLVETAVREVAEELGVVVGGRGIPAQALIDWQLCNVYEIYPVWRYRYASGVTHNQEHVFSLCVPRETPVTLSTSEHLDYEWVPWREAASRCFSPSNVQAVLRLPQFV